MSHWYNLHIKNEILFWFFLLSLVPLMLLTSVNYYYQKTNVLSLKQDQLKQLLDEKIIDLNKEVDHINKELKIISTIPTVKTALIQYGRAFEAHQSFQLKNPYFEKFFQNIIKQNRFYDLFLINTKGDIVYSAIKETDLATNLNTGRYANTNLAKVYKSSTAFLDIEFSDLDFYPPSNEEAAFSAIPIYGDNQVLGILAVQVDKERILGNLTSTRGLQQTGEFVAARLNEFGKLVPTMNMRHKPNALNDHFQFSDSSEIPIQKAISGERGKGIAVDYRGKEVVAAWSYLPVLRWGITLKVDVEEVLIPISKLRFYSILILFFVGLGIAFAILTTIHRIVTPIERLSQSVKKFTKGSFDNQVVVNIDNEIGDLSRNFNEMANSLAVSQETIQKYANELEDKVQIRTRELEVAKESLEKSNAELKEFMRIIDKYIITSTTDRTGKIIRASQAFSDITGYSKEELIGKRHNLIRHPDMPQELYKKLWQTINSGKVWQGEIKNQRKDGSYYWVDSTISPVFDQDGNIKEFTSIRQDITDKKKVEELSITDQLTRLHNRHKIDQVFQDEIQRAQRYKSPFSVILFDIDHFKHTNDNFGHDVGDIVLQKFAEILKETVRQTDFTGRWGGEEFIILAPETSEEQALILAEKVRAAIEAFDFCIVGHKTASFGVSTFSAEDSQNTLLKKADEALYNSKRNGRNQVSVR